MNAIDTLPYPRVTTRSINEKIKNTSYHILPGTTITICTIEMENGYRVIGQSACVDPRNFAEIIGREMAYNDAHNKIWALEGYLLTENLYNNAKKTNS